MITTYHASFKSRTWAAIALWELHAWNIPESHYALDFKGNAIYRLSAGAVDVITESIPPIYVIITKEQIK